MKALALLACAVALPGAAEAGTCTITSVTPVAFGAYDVFDPAPVVSTGDVTFECSGLAPTDTVRIELDGGAAGSFAPRTLVRGAFALAYNLYLDAPHASVWGDGTGGSSTYGPIHPGAGPTTVTVFGRIPARQDVAAGVYEDTITVTLQF